ncbi:MAG: hypothetical protein AAGF31_06550 [Planctomycetota bacterium]
MTNIKIALHSLLAVMAIGSVSTAQDPDIGFFQEDGQVVIGLADFISREVNFPQTVFTRNFLSFPGEFFTEDPGFFALGAGSPSIPAGLTAVPGGADVSFNFLPMTIGQSQSNLLHWDGQASGGGAATVADVDFAPSVDMQFGVNIAGGGLATVTGDDAVVPGVTIGTTSSSGALHIHGILNVLSLIGGSPTSGVYTVALEFHVDGLLPSDPVLLAIRSPGLDASTEVAAGSWLNDNYDALFTDPGDFNGDGMVDAVDYTVWRDGYSTGDFDIGDYTLWKTNFGATGGAGAIASAPLATVGFVPEPATATLLALLGLAGCGLPRRWGLR